MSRKPIVLAARDRGAVDIDLDDMPENGVVVDLDNDDPEAFEVITIDDTPEKDRGKPTEVLNPTEEPSEEELRSYGARAQDRIRRQTFELNTERRGREAMERERDEAIAAARRFKNEADELRRASSTAAATLGASMLREREASMATARAKLAAAHSEGDSEAIAEATAEISMLSSEITMIKAQTPKAPAKSDPAAPAAAEAPAQPRRQAAPLEPNVAAWIADNRDWFGRPGFEEKTAVAYSVHDKLISRGVKPSSDEYTQGLDEGLKKVFPEHKAKADANPPARSEARRGDVVAAGSRQTQPTGDNSRRITLTASQLKLARNLGVTPQAYAASLAKFQSQQKGSAQ